MSADLATKSGSAANLTVLPDDFYYELADFTDEVQSKKRIGTSALTLFSSFGFDSHKRHNLHYLDEFTLMSAVGNVLTFYNLRNMEQTYFHGLRSGAIGSIAVHPSRRYIAVAEVYHTSPSIYVFEYPGMRLYRVLRGGTTHAYADIAFNATGDKLASVGGDPDYMLTLWNWKSEAVILRSKAFSQDVSKVAFAPDSDGNLTTSGMGHIKFWKMSSTFTGLKLQGSIGKFGASELTDIAAFIQLPDGKVLSSTETGNLLLWDGGLIKCEISCKGKRPCHAGRVDVVLMVEGEVVTAGEDGFVRVWDFETIDSADVTSNVNGSEATPAAPASSSGPAQARVFEMEALEEFFIGKDVKIRAMVKCFGSASEYLVQDMQGHLFKLDTKKRSTEKILSFHSGPIAALDTSPISHAMMSLGSDGTLRLYDYMMKAVVMKRKYPSGGTALCYLPDVLDSRGCTVAAGFADGVIRLISHSPIPSEGAASDFTLHYAFKPHKCKITSIAVSQDGQYMATTAIDKTIFFFKIDVDLSMSPNPDDEVPSIIFSNKAVKVQPIGFLELNETVNSLSFSPDNHLNTQFERAVDRRVTAASENEEDVDGRRAFLTTADGSVFSLIVPTLFMTDTKYTYELGEDLCMLRPWKIEVAPPKEERVLQPGEKSPLEIELEKSGGRITSAVRKKRGGSIAKDSKASCIMYLEGGYFLMAIVNKFGEGEIRSFKFGVPNASRLLFTHSSPFTDIRLSASGKYLLAGTVDGTTCMRKLKLEDLLLVKWSHGHETYEHFSNNFEVEYEAQVLLNEQQFGTDDPLPDFGQVWIDSTHDSVRGKVNSVTTTFDDSFLCTTGNDGGLFVWRVVDEGIRKQDTSDLDAIEVDVAPAQDIPEGDVYTIQEEKIKAEKDRERNDGEIKKQLTRDHVSELQHEYLKIIAEMEKSSISDVNAVKASVQVDPDLLSDIERDTEQKIESVKRELEWISEKESIGPNKLMKKFLTDLQTETIEVGSFKAAATVATFRTTKLEQTLQSVFQPLMAADKIGSRAANTARDLNSQNGIRSNRGALDDDLHDLPSRKSTKPNDNKSKLEARKALRAERSALWNELMDEKPDESYEDPRDVAAIRYAETHMGDWKLKTGEKYIVPDSERVDADKKRRQILMLKESVFSLKEQFNAQVLQLRERKRNLITHFIEQGKAAQQISQVLAEMGDITSTPQWAPSMERSAYPELRYEVTESDIEELQRLEAEQEQKNKAENLFGGFNSAPASAPQQAVTDAKEKTKDHAGSLEKENRPSSTPKPPLLSGQELTDHDIQRKKYVHEREQITKAISRLVEEFDKSIDNLSKERTALEADIKFADIKLLLYYREWVLLKEFEKHDNALADKLVAKRNEKMDIDNKIKECQEKLNSKKIEIEQIIRREREIQETFHTSLGESNKHEEYLTKVFRKKIKRSKKKAKLDGGADSGEAGDQGSEMTEENSDNDDYFGDDDDDDLSSNESEADGSAEECPPECDPAIWQKVLELRERKLDQEDILSDIQKAIETLKKENDNLIKKEKVIDMSLKSTEAEIQDFQTQKQKKLNELDVVVPLRLHQIQFLDKNVFPTDLAQSLVFVNEGLYKLKNRIKELQQEKADIRKNHKELKKMHVSLVKSRKEKNLKLSELEARATDVQLLKFGKIIDLEKLEKMGVNRNADELREKIQREDTRRLKESEVWQTKINSLKEGLTDVTRENTILLENLVTLTESRQQLEESLNASQSSVAAEFSGLQKRDIIEREKLISLVQSQSAEIEDLKREIEVLIQKPTRLVPAQ